MKKKERIEMLLLISLSTYDSLNSRTRHISQFNMFFAALNYICLEFIELYTNLTLLGIYHKKLISIFLIVSNGANFW